MGVTDDDLAGRRVIRMWGFVSERLCACLCPCSQVSEWLVGGTNSSNSSSRGDESAAALAAAAHAWEGVLVFDECHKAKNFAPGKEAQSTKVCGCVCVCVVCLCCVVLCVCEKGRRLSCWKSKCCFFCLGVGQGRGGRGERSAGELAQGEAGAGGGAGVGGRGGLVSRV